MEGAEFGGFDRNPIKIVLLCALGELFWLTAKYDLDSGFHQEVVQYIGPKSRTALFEYEIELTYYDGKSKNTTIDKTKNFFEDVNEIFAAKRCFKISISYLRSEYMNSKKYVPGYKLTVREALLP
jgi:hypothetical protein